MEAFYEAPPKGGRLTSWSEEIEKQAWFYINDGWKEMEEAIPTIVGMCRLIKRSSSTLKKWEKDENKNFADIMSACREAQELELINQGLKKKNDSSITKLLLGKHGYHEKTERDNTSSDGSMTPTKITRTIIDTANDDT